MLYQLSYCRVPSGRAGPRRTVPSPPPPDKGDSPIFVDHGFAAVPAKTRTVPRHRWLAPNDGAGDFANSSRLR